MDARRRREGGIALLTVLWVLVLLSIMAATSLRGTRADASLARNLEDAARAQALADGGVHAAVAGLLARAPATWRADGTPYVLETPEGTIRLALRAELGKVDLNKAPEPLLAAVLGLAGMATDEAASVAAAIADYRDPDDMARLRGAESAEYERRGLAHGPANRQFLAVSELGRVAGMPTVLADRLAPYVTVHSGAPSVDPVFAAPELMAGLPGMRPEIARRLAALRERGAAPRLRRNAAVSVLAEATTPSGAMAARAAIVRVTGEGGAPFRVLSWSDTTESVPRRDSDAP